MHVCVWVLRSARSLIPQADEKARAAFDLYDYNGDGVISLDEMTRYLTSVFKVMYEAEPGTQARMGGASAEAVAAQTAQQAFAEADLDGDGNLTFEEFQEWYSVAPGPTAEGAADATAAAASSMSLSEVRRLTNLSAYADGPGGDFFTLEGDL